MRLDLAERVSHPESSETTISLNPEEDGHDRFKLLLTQTDAQTLHSNC